MFSIQVFLKPRDGNLVPLLPVVSSLIKDKRAHPDLNIVDISDDTSPVEGMYQQIFHYLFIKTTSKSRFELATFIMAMIVFQILNWKFWFVSGGKKILLFCSKIKKEDIEVLFIHYGKGKLD